MKHLNKKHLNKKPGIHQRDHERTCRNARFQIPDGGRNMSSPYLDQLEPACDHSPGKMHISIFLVEDFFFT